MTFSIELRTLVLPLRDPFVIARGSHGEGLRATTVVAELRDDADGPDGHVGLGEGFPDRFYGETPETIGVVVPLLLEAIEPAAAGLRGDLAEARAALDDAADRMAAAIAHHGAAKCAIDIALHDLVGKRLGLPIRDLLGIDGPIPPTDFTLGIDEPAVVAERARRAADFPALKVKVGGPSDVETVRAVRAVFAGPIRVDANTGWSPEEAAALIPELQRLGVELIEQPYPPRRLDDLRALQARSPLPLVADESAVTIDDLDALAGVVAGVNVKLAKCGGVGPARRMLERARERGFRTFLGCMEETSIGIAASAAVAAARRLGGPRRLPAARRGPGRGPGARGRQAVGAPGLARTRAALAGVGRPLTGIAAADMHLAMPRSGGPGVIPSTALPALAGPVHRGLRAVDKSGGNMVEKPLPTPRRRTYHVPIAGDRGTRGREHRAYRQIPPAAGCPGPPPDRPRTPRGRGDPHRCCPPAPPPARRQRPRPSCASATSAAAWGGRSCMTRCARWRRAGCTGGWDTRRSRRSASGSACSRPRGWRSS